MKYFSSKLGGGNLEEVTFAMVWGGLEGGGDLSSDDSFFTSFDMFDVIRLKWLNR